MIIGHAVAADIANRHFLPVRLPFPVLVVTAYLPDIFDKCLNKVAAFPARGYFHSLSATVILFLLCYLVSVQLLQKDKKYIFSGGILYFLHIAGDLLDWNILLWPVFGPIPFVAHFEISTVLHNFYVLRIYQDVFILEIFVILIAIALRIYENKFSGSKPLPESPPTQE